MDQPVQIRIAEPSDARQIMAVINSAFRVAEEFFCFEDRITLEEVERLFTTGTFLLAESDRLLAGCVYVELRGERSYLGLLSVDQSRQQGGLGSLLMNAGEKHCRERGSSFMDIYLVNLRTELFPFYQKRGYVETGTHPFPPEVKTTVPCHFITMAKQL